MTASLSYIIDSKFVLYNWQQVYGREKNKRGGVFKKFRDSNIFYKFIDRKSEVVNVFLHGWGCTHESLLFCQDHIKQSALFVDFPPFGKSDCDIRDWTIFTYANMVMSICEHLKLNKLNLIGHSFGGRVAIILAVLCKEKINKVVLVSSAGLKPRRSLSYHMCVWAYKLKKKFGFNVSKYGSEDWKNLSPNMKKIFSSVVNTHLDDFVPFITAPTLIIFGQNDKTTPVWMAKKLHRKIKNSSLVLLSGAGHFCFDERRFEFLSAVKNFLLE